MVPRTSEWEAALQERLLPIVRVAGEDARGRMEERLTHYGCPGVAVTVLEDGAAAYQRGFGRLERGGERRVQPDSVFAGASISKPLTAALVMQQVERGRLDLDVDVNRYLKAWQVPGNPHTRAQPVTLRHLLSHRAGTTVHGFGGFPPGAVKPTVLDTLLGRAPALTPPVVVDKTPGGSIRYSGGGYTVVQLVLEETTGQPFAQLAREMIFEPLGMQSSSFEDPLPEALVARAASGHDAGGLMLPERWPCCPQSAAGGLYTSAPDFARFLGACRDAYIGRQTLLMAPATARAMIDSRGDGDFALGWRVLGQGESLRIAHGGSNEGFQCETTCYLASGQGAVVLTNAVSGAQFYWEVLNTAAEVGRWPGFLRAPKVLQVLDATARRRLVGRYALISGVDAPFIDVIDIEGQLFSHIEGMRAPPAPVLMDQDGRLFNRYSPYQTDVVYGNDGRALELIAFDGGTEVLRARRSAASTS